MKLRRILALTALAVASYGVVASQAAPAPLHQWKAPIGGVFRSAALTGGEWVWTNGVWQARGANTDGLHRTDYFKVTSPTADQPTHIPRDVYNAVTYDFFGSHRLTHNGDFQLPADEKTWPAGTGEVSEVRLAADATSLYVRLLWNSMPRVDAQLATLTFRTVGTTPPARDWPHGANLMGSFDVAATFSGAGVAVSPLHATPSTTVADEHHVTSRVDLRAHTTEARIPLELLPRGPWTLAGGSGLALPGAADVYWQPAPGPATSNTPGTGGAPASNNIWGLFFATDKPWSFDERAQADELASGKSTSGVTVDPTALQHRATEHSGATTGDFSVLFQSHYFGGDGISKARNGLAPVGPDTIGPLPVQTTGFDESWTYTGRLQTYSMHVPKSYSSSSGAKPLVVYLHGFTGLPEEPFHNPVGLVNEIDKRGWLLASALGRGDLYYTGAGDLDVMEVIADVSKHYNVDPNRIYLMGHSMGGYGTDNVATHHPDVFAAVAPAEGTSSAPLALNLRNVPWFVMTADEDLDTGAKNALAFYKTLSDAGDYATALEYRLKIHEYSSIYDTLPRLMAFFATSRRIPNPAVVTYIKSPGEERRDLGLSYDGAYWISGMQAADAKTAARIDAESFAIPHIDAKQRQAKAIRIDQMVDETGPTGRTIAQLHQTIPGLGALAPLARRIVITATNLSTATVDLDRAGIPRSGISMRLIVTATKPMTLTLTNAGFVRTLHLRAGVTNVKLVP